MRVNLLSIFYVGLFFSFSFYFTEVRTFRIQFDDNSNNNEKASASTTITTVGKDETRYDNRNNKPYPKLLKVEALVYL